MKKTVTIPVLKSMLTDGNVEFTYKKKNGEIRNVVGTTSKIALERVGITFADKDSGCQQSVRYYDISKNAWRSFSVQCNNTVEAEAI